MLRKDALVRFDIDDGMTNGRTNVAGMVGMERDDWADVRPIEGGLAGGRG